MFKTPVSMLQEMMTKESIVPNYNLTHNGGGTHSNSFTYKVTCGEYVASGSGRSKKDAKHEAAEAMLRTIAEHRNYPQLPESSVQSPVRTPLPPTVAETPRIPPNVPFINFVGRLQELCVNNKLEDPVYVQISDVGPPHARIFTIQCQVTTFKETGIARTKKQAKQDAAKKMLDILGNLVSDATNFSGSKVLEEEQTKESIQKAKTSYITLSKSGKKVNLGVKLCMIHKELKNTLGEESSKQLRDELNVILPKLNEFLSNQAMSDVRSELEKVISSYELLLSITTIKTKIPSQHAVCIHLNGFNIVQIGSGATPLKAEIDATVKLIECLLLILE